MTPSIEVAGVPATSENTQWREKTPLAVELAPTAESPSASSLSPVEYPKTQFELQDHPIDVVRKLRVGQIPVPLYSKLTQK
jgi:hypothetical protein